MPLLKTSAAGKEKKGYITIRFTRLKPYLHFPVAVRLNFS